jgi:hypothetical protein
MKLQGLPARIYRSIQVHPDTLDFHVGARQHARNRWCSSDEHDSASPTLEHSAGPSGRSWYDPQADPAHPSFLPDRGSGTAYLKYQRTQKRMISASK